MLCLLELKTCRLWVLHCVLPSAAQLISRAFIEAKNYDTTRSKWSSAEFVGLLGLNTTNMHYSNCIDYLLLKSGYFNLVVPKAGGASLFGDEELLL